jgi:hypothetical protein
MSQFISNEELKKYKVGDAVATCDGDIGRIVERYQASPGWDDNEEWSDLFDRDEFMAGAVIDLGPRIGKFRFDVAYFRHYDGPVPENSEGFMAELVLPIPELTGTIQDKEIM